MIFALYIIVTLLICICLFLSQIVWQNETYHLENKYPNNKVMQKAIEERIERNRAAALRESKYIGWTDAHTQGRWRSIHSEEYQQKMGKKDRGYY